MTVLLAILAFTRLVRLLGTAPAVIVLVLVASTAGGRLSLARAAALAGAPALLAVLPFKRGLDLPVPIVARPW